MTYGWNGKQCRISSQQDNRGKAFKCTTGDHITRETFEKSNPWRAEAIMTTAGIHADTYTPDTHLLAVLMLIVKPTLTLHIWSCFRVFSNSKSVRFLSV